MAFVDLVFLFKYILKHLSDRVVGSRNGFERDSQPN